MINIMSNLRIKGNIFFVNTLLVFFPLTAITYIGYINKRYIWSNYLHYFFNPGVSVQLNNVITTQYSNQTYNSENITLLNGNRFSRGRDRYERRYFYALRRLKQENKKIEQIYFKNKNKVVKNLENNTINKCTVCLENIARIAFSNCGHVSCCNDCSFKLRNTCPICREKGIRIPLFF